MIYTKNIHNYTKLFKTCENRIPYDTKFWKEKYLVK